MLGPRSPSDRSRLASATRAGKDRALRWGLRLGLGMPALACMACAAPGQLVASDGSHRLVARDDATGITVVMTTESWPEQDYVTNSDLTIVHLLVSNLSNERVLLAPGDFELVDSRGFRYSLRDAGGRFRLEGQPDQGYDPGQSGDFMPISGGELARNALPWGVLEPGSQMRGFVYFDSLVNRANHAELIWHAETPTHRGLADFAFPLSVSRSFGG